MRARTAALVAAVVPLTVTAAAVALKAGAWGLDVSRHEIRHGHTPCTWRTPPPDRGSDSEPEALPETRPASPPGVHVVPLPSTRCLDWAESNVPTVCPAGAPL